MMPDLPNVGLERDIDQFIVSFYPLYKKSFNIKMYFLFFLFRNFLRTHFFAPMVLKFTQPLLFVEQAFMR